MNRSHLREAMTALAGRLKAATVGFGITVAPLAFIAMAHFAFVPQIVGAREGSVSSGEHAARISELRMAWFAFHALAVTLVAIYWLLTAVLGRGQLLRFRAANVTLGLFVLVIMAAAPFYAFVPWPDDLKGICPFLDISDEYTNPYALDAQSSCDSFVYAARTITVLGLIGLPVPLLIASVIVRIVSSRRASRLTNNASPPFD
jgi:hypothetical protein